MHEGRKQTGRRSAYAGSRLKLSDVPGRSRLIRQPSSRTRENPAVPNDRGDRGNVGIIRSPVRASILPDHKGHSGLRYQRGVDERMLTFLLQMLRRINCAIKPANHRFE